MFLTCVSNSNCRDPGADYGRHAGFPSGKRSEVQLAVIRSEG